MKWLLFIAKTSIRLIGAFIFFTLYVNMALHANPVPRPTQELVVSELMFDSNGKWVMELGGLCPVGFSNGKNVMGLCELYPYYFLEIDSICITSSNSRIKVNNLPYGDENIPKIILLRNDSLDSNLIIKQTGDFIKITTYYSQPQWYYGDQFVDSLSNTLIFGNYEGATVRSPNESESIVWISDYLYSINKTPTIGQLPKDGSGTHTTIKFNIHYPDWQPFTASFVKLCDNNNKWEIDLNREDDGSYSGEVYYCSYSLSKMYFNIQPPYVGYWLISPCNISLDWDTYWNNFLWINIYLTQFVDIKPIQAEASILKIYPNPVKDNSFNYETVLPVNSTNCTIEITKLNGQKIGQYPVSESKGKINLSSNIPQGIYFIKLNVNNKNYANTKIMIQ